MCIRTDKRLKIIKTCNNSYKETLIEKCIFQVIDGILKLLEGIIQIISFGFYEAFFSYQFCWWRISRKKKKE